MSSRSVTECGLVLLVHFSFGQWGHHAIWSTIDLLERRSVASNCVNIIHERDTHTKMNDYVTTYLQFLKPQLLSTFGDSSFSFPEKSLLPAMDFRPLPFCLLVWAGTGGYQLLRFPSPFDVFNFLHSQHNRYLYHKSNCVQSGK